MNFSDAVKSIIKPHKHDRLSPLFTKWGESMDTANVLSEYPRPQMRRDSFISLNGYWDYAITDSPSIPAGFEGKILVPFSPEAALSGINRQLKPDEFLWYRTVLPDACEQTAPGMRLLLHFGAVDYEAEVFVNGTLAAAHRGGYLPFHADITDLLKGSGNELLLKVKDTTGLKSEARGKQTLARGGIFYTAQSGIWQSVWLEQVPFSYIENLWFETDYDKRTVTARISAHRTGEIPSFALSLLCRGQEIPCLVSCETISAPDPGTVFTASLSFTIPEEYFHSWSPEDPFLYDVKLTFGRDQVQSYFAMRLFSIEKPENQENTAPVFCLNHKPYFLMGVLDQGYWPDGLYTAPADEALIYDITVMKSLGFNMLRKHIKAECARWYYHCDRLGMIVCQDMVNGGSRYHMPVISYLPTLFPRMASRLKDSHYAMLSRKDMAARQQWEQECLETVAYLKFFPSIAIWVPFNEGWGQFDTARITNLIKEADPHRLVDSASGWFDQNCGDFISVHNYFRPLSVPVKKWDSRAFFLSEYGGYACHIKGHSSVERIFGYKRYNSLADFQSAYRNLIENSLMPLKSRGLCAAVYTQLSDVEEEVNGILSYDRKINKLL
ncbi:MAG: glycoside hydrolase family 2 [Lachnospiraceae bacterium]|nr:glycoside hydrolase family 2 [Lachnospiraceae bacterium]